MICPKCTSGDVAAYRRRPETWQCRKCGNIWRAVLAQEIAAFATASIDYMVREMRKLNLELNAANAARNGEER